MRGTVKSICKKTPDAARSTFGFIRGVDGIDRFFLPGHMVQPAPELDSLRQGDQVEFEHADGPVKDGKSLGPRAVNVKLIAASDEAVSGV